MLAVPAPNRSGVQELKERQGGLGLSNHHPPRGVRHGWLCDLGTRRPIVGGTLRHLRAARRLLRAVARLDLQRFQICRAGSPWPLPLVAQVGRTLP